VSKAAAVEQAAALADYIRGQRSDLSQARQQVDSQLASDVGRANVLLDEIASLNLAVVEAELGGGSDPSLRDQRDGLVEELATLIDINVIERDSGSVDILVGSTPVVLGTDARGLEFERRTVDGELEVRVLVSDSQEQLNVTSGTIGARLAERDQAIDEVIDRLDELASSVIYEVNRLHSSGRPARPITTTTSWLSIPTAEQALAFNDPTNLTLADLDHRPTSGTFQVVITDAQGHSETTTITIDLDGLTSTGAPGFTDDTSLASLTADLDGIANLTATITPDGKLQLTAAQGYDVSFKDDTTGALAVLGVNTLFHGSNSTDITINPEIEQDPQRLVVGLSEGSNEAALAIAALREAGVASLGGESITARWLNTVEKNSVDVAAAATRAEAATTVKQSLEAQHAGLAGVSLDEESLNLISYQQAYQGAANFISVVNELTQVLLNLV
jgi:flagellar hook-associated protein 1 FlgK